MRIERLFGNVRCTARGGFVVATLILAIIGWVNGQALTSRPDRGSSGPGTQAVSEIDSVNVQNGGVSLSIPLASLPPIAGGKLSYTLTASYNSKLWEAYRTEVLASPPEVTQCPSSFTKTEIGASGGGWRIGGRYEIFFRSAREDYDYLQPDSQCIGQNEWDRMQGVFFKPMLRMPDGSEHELRIEGSFPTYSPYATGRDHLHAYYKLPGGNAGDLTDPAFAAPIRLYTVDGTYLTAIYHPQSDPIRWTLYMKDGTRIEQSRTDYWQQRIIDTNNNSILLGWNVSGGYLFAKDEHTGREIKWSSSTYNGQPATKVEYQSVGGSWQSVWVVWGQTTVQGKIYKTHVSSPDGGILGCWASTVLEATFGVVRKIVLPVTETGIEQKYEFNYNSDTTVQATNSVIWGDCVQPPETYTRDASIGYGELSKITTPSQATYEYEYGFDGFHDVGHILFESADHIMKNAVGKKTVTHDGTTDIWNYTSDSFNLTGGTVTNPDGSTFTEQYIPGYVAGFSGGPHGLGGLQISSKEAGRILTEKHWTLLGGNLTAYGNPNSLVTYNPVVDTEYTTLLAEDGTRQKMSARKFLYDYNGELTQTIEFDWFDPANVTFHTGGPYHGTPTAVPASAVALRVTNKSYYNDAGDASSPNAYHRRTVSGSTLVLGKVKESTVGTGSTVKSHTKFSYDSQSFGSAPTLGNLTKASAWDDSVVNGQWLDTITTYTTRGNVQSTTDANGNVTQITYGSINGNSDLYPTQTVQAYGTSLARTSSAVYDFYAGLVTTTTDVDNGISVATEYDILGRPTKVKNAPGTPLESWTVTQYSDSNRRVIVKSDLETVGDGKKIAVQHFDQLGRVRLVRTIENPATEDPTNEQHGIKVEAKYIASAACPYDSNKTCSFTLTSNPFRAATSSAASGEATMGWTLSHAQNDGRRSETQTFSGAALPSPFATSSPNTSSTGIVKTIIDANATTVEDQAGKLRRSITDGLGRLVRVDEPNGSNQLDVSGNPYQPTAYTYDVLNNLLTVTQAGSGTEQCRPAGGTCSQTRTFTFSSLSRLLTAANPESGTISYQYDSNGNLTRKTDARGVQTDYVYDALNRVTNRNYSTPGGTPSNYQASPNVTYTYGTSAPAIGKLTKAESSVSTTEYTAFDILGRVTASTQETDDVTYGNGITDSPMTYTYNLSGALIEQQYPSGRKVQNTFDASGDLEIVKSRKNASSGYWAYANNFTYNAVGAVASMQLGNGTWESTSFNSRLQPEQIALGTVQSGHDKLKLNYGYGTTANNGNVLNQTITVPTVGSNPGFTAVQNYTYDSLNRLASADEKPQGWTGCTSDPTKCWTQEFSYDRYGNRNFVEANTTTLPKNCGSSPNFTVCPADRKKLNPSISPNNSRIVLDQDSDTVADYGFDPSGNTTMDADGRTFIYDGENKQVEVKNSSNVTSGKYWYDGDGKRVKKEVPATGEVTIFVYDAMGKLVAEYSTIVAPSEDAKVAYLTNDHLGSSRINTDKNGNVTARHDYHPFGEETATSQRIGGLGYVDDTVRQRFTSKERDSETGMDYFMARFYSPGLGRFTTPDEFLGGPEELYEFDGKIGHNPTFYAELTDPQSLNKYGYCLNNPINYIDPDGHQTQIADTLWRAYEAVKESVKGLIYPLANEVQEAKNGTPPPDRVNTPLGDFADGNSRNLVKRTWKDLADRTERAYDAISYFDVTGTSSVLKLVVNQAAGRGNSTSDYVITLGAGILTRGKGSGQAKLVIQEARQLIGRWSTGTTFGRSVAQLINHAFKNHGASVGAKDKLQYLRKASGFNKSGARRTVLQDGNIHYQRSDGTYLITDPRGRFISYGRN